MRKALRVAVAVVAALWFGQTTPNARDGSAPILLVVNSGAANPYGPYLAEILQAEGITAFATVELSSLSAPVLDAARLVVLAETPLTAGQASLLTAYVGAGGRLIAMRPDAQLNGVLGLTDLGPSSAERYLAIHAGTYSGSGLQTDTLPFWGPVQRYQTDALATTVATLYSDRTTATAYPAVVRFGTTATWAFDLARSTVLTRQGKPENAGLIRDGTDAIRTTSLFYGDIDLDRVGLPHADIQMRLFSRLIADLLADTLPLPRLWYFPGTARTLLVPTADTHVYDDAGTQAQIASIEAHGGVLTMYISRWVPYPTAEQASTWRANGHEFGLHPYGSADNATIEEGFQLSADWFAANGLGTPSRTVRIHQVEWPSWVGPAQVAAGFNIAMDTSFYTWGPAVTYPDGHQAHGFINGSGLPMRFVDQSGAIIPVYQQVTSLIDEQLVTGPWCEELSAAEALAVSQQLIDESQAGGYSALVTQFHTDYYSYGNVLPWVEGTMDYAQSLGIPMWTAERWLEYTEARAATQVTEVTWSAPTATFVVTVPAEAEPQSVMLPAVHAGFGLTTLTVDGAPATPVVQAVNGRDVVFFSVGPGAHAVTAIYDTPVVLPNRAPVALDDVASVAQAGTVTVAVLANDDDPDGDPLTVTEVTQGQLGTVVINADNTVTYTVGEVCGEDSFTYTVSDGQGGTATATVEVTVLCPGGQITLTTAADFAACGAGSGTIVTAVGDGELRLAGVVGDEYGGATLDPALWAYGTWEEGSYTPIPSGGVLSVAGAGGAYVRSAAALDVTTLEATVSFSAATWESVGWGTLDFVGPYLLFSTYNGTTNLYARSNDGTGEQRTDLGPIPTGFHTYRIERAVQSELTDVIRYYMDGELKAQHTVVTMPALYVYQTHDGGVSPTLDIDRIWVYPAYVTAGTFTSCVTDTGGSGSWQTLVWTASVPADTSLVVTTRTSTDAVTWSAWSAPLPAGGGALTSPEGRYLQYQLAFSTTSALLSPVLESVTANSGTADLTPPVISAVAAGGLTTTTATITWTTDEGATSQVLYGLTEAFGLSTTLDPTRVTSHSQTLTGLAPATPYFFQVVSRDASGNEASSATLSFTTPSCVYAILPLSESFTAGGGTGSVAVTATAGCAWTATSNDLWITVTGGSSGTGDGTVAYSVAPSTDSVARSGSVGIAGEVFTVNQAAQPTLAIANTSVAEGQTGTVNASFTVTLSSATTQTVTAAYATADGTAAAGSDYTAASGTVTIAPGTLTQTILVPIVGDTVYELDETFTVTLSAPSGATIAQATATGTILNDEAVPTLAIANTSVAEGQTGTVNATFTVTLSGASSQTVTVGYATANGTATAGSDYTTTSGTLTFTPGTLTQDVLVPVAGDTVYEPDETFTVTLSAPSGATIAQATGTGTILNDEAAPTLSIGNVSVAEGHSGTANATLTVTLSNASSQTVTVAYATANGTATAPSDYTTSSGTLTLTPGTLTQDVLVPIAGDTVYEPDETFTVTLSAPSGATIAQGTATGTILNDEAVPTLAIANTSVTEGQTGTVNASFTITLSGVSSQEVRVAYATSNGTATDGSDYTASAGTLAFAPGALTQNVLVPVAGDAVYEPDETFTVTLSAPSGATIAQGTATGTILNDEPVPTLAIANASVTEGHAGTVNASFTVTLSGASSQTVTVGYATANGTATAGSDYTTTSGTLSFSPGTLTQNVLVPVAGDAVYEPDETFTVTLSAPSGATIAQATGTGTILNDDAMPTLAIANLSVTEGNSGTANATFTVTLSGASGQAVTATYATSDATAAAGSDYTAASGTVTVAPGTLSQTILVPIAGDTVYEPDETLTITLSAPSGATIAQGTATGTILNDDAAPTLSIGNVSVTEGHSGTANATFTVALSNASSQTVTVGYATANGTATAGSDYTTGSGTLTFTAGTLTQTIVVPVLGDTVYEPDETFTVTLSAPSGATIAQATGTGTIQNDEAVPTLAIANLSVTEGNSGTANASFTVTLSGASSQTVTVGYATANGTATAGSDYTTGSGTLTFTAGTLTQSLVVPILGDAVYEPDETFTVTLSAPSGAAIAQGTATGTILNDEAVPALAIANVSVTEGHSGAANATFTATLSGASSQTVTVAYATANGTATAGSDYTTGSGTLTFTPGTLTQTVVVPILGDTVYEPDETFTITLSSPSGATIAQGTATGTILNDEGVPGLSVGDVSVAEGNAGTANATFTVTLSRASSQTVTVAYATANATATAGSDYTAASGTLTFAPGTVTQTIVVPVIGDVVHESSETFTVTLSGPAGATIAQGTATGTIFDDDGPPALAIGPTSVAEGQIGATMANFTVTLLGTSSQTVTVGYATADGTATAGSDYTAASGTLSFAPGTLTQTIAVPVSGDVVYEPDEAFTVTLLSPSGATITQGTATGTILNDDVVPTLSIGNVAVTEGQTGTVAATFTVTLSGASSQTVTVAYATANVTAAAGSDYTAASSTLSFAPGTLTQTIVVPVAGDAVHEPDETFTITLSSPSGATIAQSTAIGTILNDDAVPALSIGNTAVTEGHTGTVPATFTVTLSGASSQTVTVNYTTTNGTAAAGSDYAAGAGTLSFAPGTLTRTILVPVTGDTVYEPDETFMIGLADAVGAAIAQGTATCTILNDEAVPALSVANVSVTEGDAGTVTATFTVTLSGASSQTVTVKYATADGTAKAASDYTAASGTLSFAPGTVSHTVDVQVAGDNMTESNETFTLTLSAPAGATLAKATATGTILSDEAVRSEFVDLNADGLGDIVSYKPGTGQWQMVMSTAAGALAATTGQWSPDWTIKTGDFNADGATDLFFFNAGTGAWYVGVNDGLGNFTYLPGAWSAGWTVYVLDLNGDARSDVFVYNAATGVWYQCLTTTPGTFTYHGGQWSVGWDLWTADFDGNGRGDIFVFNRSTGAWYQCLSDGAGGFTYVPGQWSPGWGVTIGDLNGDRKSDVFAFNESTGAWYVCLATDGGFAHTPGSWSTGWRISAADFDADGLTDIFVYNPVSGAWFVCRSNGVGGFTYAGQSWSPDWEVHVTDYNGDGKADVLVYNATTGQYFKCLTTGMGTFEYTAGRWDAAWSLMTRVGR